MDSLGLEAVILVDVFSKGRKFQAVVDSLPNKDAHPIYEPRASNPWDMKLKGQ